VNYPRAAGIRFAAQEKTAEGRTDTAREQIAARRSKKVERDVISRARPTAEAQGHPTI